MGQLIVNGYPRRIQIDEWITEERMLFDATQAIEALGCHKRLTDAIVHLSEAREALADWVELRCIPAEERAPKEKS